jgi:benzoate-CoA ligase
MSDAASPPPERFNFAEHLFQANVGRARRLAYIDDHGQLDYGSLAEQARRCATALVAAVLRREERVLLLMHDCNHWPVAFLGCLHAGLVPVAVNTLLTPADYAYILEHSRAQAAIVSGALLPTLEKAMQASAHELGTLVVSRGEPGPPAAESPIPVVDFDAWLAAHAPAGAPASTLADSIGFWLYSSGSTGRPKGTVHTHGNLYWTAELYGKPVLGLTESDAPRSS